MLSFPVWASVPAGWALGGAMSCYFTTQPTVFPLIFKFIEMSQSEISLTCTAAELWCIKMQGVTESCSKTEMLPFSTNQFSAAAHCSSVNRAHRKQLFTVFLCGEQCFSSVVF